VTVEAQPIAAVVVGPDGRVQVTAPCIQCGYNLRTLLADAVCPECAYPIAQSLRGDFLRFARPNWVRGLRNGATLLIAALFCMLALMFLAPLLTFIWIVPTAATGGTPPPGAMSTITLVQAVLGMVPVVVGLIGLAFFTQRDPARIEVGISARAVARLGLYVTPIAVVLGLVNAFVWSARMPPAMMGRVPLTFSTFEWVLFTVVGILALYSYLITPLALLWHVSGLLRRVPRPGLVRLARVVFWGLTVSASIATLFYAYFFIGFAIPMLRVLSTLPTTTAPPTAAPFASPYFTATTSPAAAPATAPAVVVTTREVVLPALRQPAIPGTAGAGVMPATAPTTMPAMPVPSLPMMLASVVGGLGGCVAFIFAIVGIVLLFFTRSAFAQAAREAEANEAVRHEVVAAPMSP